MSLSSFRSAEIGRQLDQFVDSLRPRLVATELVRLIIAFQGVLNLEAVVLATLPSDSVQMIFDEFAQKVQTESEFQQKLAHAREHTQSDDFIQATFFTYFMHRLGELHREIIKHGTEN